VEQNDLFLQGVEHFQRGDYFEAHEVWEELWREATVETRAFYKGLIQLAVALLHAERGNRRGAERLFHSALRLLKPYRPTYAGYDLDTLLRESEQWLQKLYSADSQSISAREWHRPRFPSVRESHER
jgi:predicted metal-dependent hydrolase